MTPTLTPAFALFVLYWALVMFPNAFSISCAGWQDLGSSFRVRTVSVQDQTERVFEAERLVLAPGAWAWDAFQLFGLDLNLQVSEVQANGLGQCI